jgi:hypothetical protein
MRKANGLAASALALALVGCAAGVALESPTPEPAAAGDAAAVCIGRNAQDLDVPMPAAGWGLAWNETDDEARATMLRDVFAPDGTHAQPDLRFTSRAELAEHLGAFHANRIGEYFEWSDWQAWYVQRDRVFMPWRLCGPDRTVLLEGFDVGHIGPGGLLFETTSFYPGE